MLRGGVTEMSLVALALSLDVAFVATHHLARILMIVTGAPIAFRLPGIARGPWRRDRLAC
ncbi:MAG: AbrB family transcriptional regulator [Alphaproteobacteria bacterium]|nr:AbrB family transcriptional regulator [Alphaproteobacteria bacterium]